MTDSLFDRVQEAVAAIRRKSKTEPQVAIILGTGLGGLAKELTVEAGIEYREIPGFVHSTVETHTGRLLLGTLEGKPTVSELKKIHIGADVLAQHKYDWAAEYSAIKSYNAVIKLAGQVNDGGTREFLEGIVKDEEAHIDWIEAQLDQIKQMGIQIYLTEQIG